MNKYTPNKYTPYVSNFIGLILFPLIVPVGIFIALIMLAWSLLDRKSCEEYFDKNSVA